MAEKRVPISIDFSRILVTLAKEIYDTPLAFLRENVQNAIDAIRMAKVDNPGFDGRVSVAIDGQIVRITDNGVGMSEEEMQTLFWNMGASGKNTAEARRAGCIGTFGIGGFANFGVCEALQIVSKKPGHEGCKSALSKEDFPASGAPEVTYTVCEDAAPQGTIVTALLTQSPNIEELKGYLQSFIRYADEKVYFDSELLSGDVLIDPNLSSRFTALVEGPVELELDNDAHINVRFFKDDGNTLIAHVISVWRGSEEIGCKGVFRLENGSLQVFKRGFKLCNVSVPTSIGFTGRLDADVLQPTAGRDSLSAESQRFVARLCKRIEDEATKEIVKSPELLSSNTRILPDLLRRGCVEELHNLHVTLADGSTVTLGQVKEFVESGGRVYYGRQINREILDLLQKSGNRIVILSSDARRRQAESTYLQQHCGASSYESLVEIKERYESLSTFELAFLSYLETAVRNRYEVYDFTVIAASLTGGIPVYTRGQKRQSLQVYVDVRHNEVQKLAPLASSPLLYSMATEFCKEYLSGILKARSPKFFGAGALSFDDIVKKTAELWTIVSADIDVQTWGVQAEAGPSRMVRRAIGAPQIVVAADVQEIEVGSEEDEERQENRKPKILRIIDRSGELDIDGFYFRLMDAPARVFGNDIQAMDEAAVFWFGNRITYVFSDQTQTALHYELRLERILRIESDGAEEGPGGMLQLQQPIQEYVEGMFLPIPKILEPFLVPQGDAEVVVRVNYEWFDLREGRVWDVSGASVSTAQ